MKLPNIWGQGSLFAYSGLDGENTLSNSLVGTLSGDRIGILFNTKIPCQLNFILKNVCDIDYEIVASDIIKAQFKCRSGETRPFVLLFHSQDTVVGSTSESALPQIFFEEAVQSKTDDNITIYELDGEYAALIGEKHDQDTSFAYAVSKESQADAVEKVKNAVKSDIHKLALSKLEFFERLPKVNGLDENTEKMYYKCFSVMKSQVYTSEGRFTTRWTTPDRLPHKLLWLWDSVFHSIGNKYISPELAFESIKAIFATQAEDGFIPHMSSPEESSHETQPPVIAWGIYMLYSHTKDRRILEDTYDGLKKYLQWNMRNRDSNHNLLLEWKVEVDSVHCRCGECGMDNSPRFDNVQEMDCIDFSCFMANEARFMAEISCELGLTSDETYWAKYFADLKKAINEVLWDEKDQLYYDRLLDEGGLKNVKAVSSFLPLFAGICEPYHAECLVKHLQDALSFKTVLPIPTISMDDQTFGTDMWRGPVWINYNYLIALGLKEYGYEELAGEIIRKTIAAVTFWYMQDGTIYEFYDSMDRVSPRKLNRKSKALEPYQYRVRMQSIRDYGWSCTLLPAMILEH